MLGIEKTNLQLNTNKSRYNGVDTLQEMIEKNKKNNSIQAPEPVIKKDTDKINISNNIETPKTGIHLSPEKLKLSEDLISSDPSMTILLLNKMRDLDNKKHNNLIEELNNIESYAHINKTATLVQKKHNEAYENIDFFQYTQGKIEKKITMIEDAHSKIKNQVEEYTKLYEQKINGDKNPKDKTKTEEEKKEKDNQTPKAVPFSLNGKKENNKTEVKTIKINNKNIPISMFNNLEHTKKLFEQKNKTPEQILEQLERSKEKQNSIEKRLNLFLTARQDLVHNIKEYKKDINNNLENLFNTMSNLRSTGKLNSISNDTNQRQSILEKLVQQPSVYNNISNTLIKELTENLDELPIQERAKRALK